MSKKRKTLLIVLVSLTFCFSACQPEEDKPRNIPTKQVIISEPYRSMQNASLYIAISQGFFKKEGLEALLITQVDFAQTAEKLTTDEVHFAISTAEKILHLHQQKKRDFCLIGQLSTSEAYYLLARNEDLGERLKIKGKAILGYQGGDLPWILLYAEFRRDNLKPFLSYSPIENLPYEEIPAVYEAGSGSYILTEEPFVSKLESEGSGLILQSLQLTNRDIPAHTVMVSRNYLQQNPTLCHSFFAAVKEAGNWLEQESPAVIAETLQPFFPDYPEKVLQRAAGRYKNTGCWEVSPISEGPWQKMQEIMLQEKELLEIIPLNTFTDAN